MVKRTVVKIKNPWYMFWKPKETIKIITDCNHKWKELERQAICGWNNNVEGYIILYNCVNCGDMKKVELNSRKAYG